MTTAYWFLYIVFVALFTVVVVSERIYQFWIVELYFKATLLRLHRREVNITADELAEAEKYVLVAHYIGDKVLCQIGTAEAWPESEQRIDVIGSNGNNGEHYDDGK